MEEIMLQIEEALNHELYYIALQSALTLPDICGALASENGMARRPKYIKWYNTYFQPLYNLMLTGQDCYYFRCAFLHQAYFNHPESSYDKIVFFSNMNMVVDNNIINILTKEKHEKWYTVHIDTFCRNIIAAVRIWLKEADKGVNFKKNYDNMIKLHKGDGSFLWAGADVIY